jgi:hypothetical protein
MLASSKHKYSKTLAFPDTYYELIINVLQSVELFCAYFCGLSFLLSIKITSKLSNFILHQFGGLHKLWDAPYELPKSAFNVLFLEIHINIYLHNWKFPILIINHNYCYNVTYYIVSISIRYNTAYFPSVICTAHCSGK